MIKYIHYFYTEVGLYGDIFANLKKDSSYGI